VKDEMATTHANSGIESTPPLRDSLSVEVKVREVDPKRSRPAQVKCAGDGRSRMDDHLLVLGAVLAIATVYVGVHIGKGWVPADDGILARARCA